MIVTKKNIFEKIQQLLKQTLTFLLMIMILTGCASYKIPTQQIPPKKKYRCQENPTRTKALSHPLYTVIPRHRCQIRWYDLPHWITWSLFGNDDDGIFGEEPSAHYKPEMPISSCKAAWWFFRNPFHNFTFYVIGTAHWNNGELDLLRIAGPRVSLGHYRCPGKTTFPSKRYSCFYLALHGGKPFVSLRLIHSRTRKTDIYFGWRPRGNFGIKCVLFGKRKSP
jgi:hypothetical protein